MELAHEPGCDRQHGPRQRCSVPGAVVCPSCGKAASPDASFCGYCGAALQGAPADQPSARPTRRQSPAMVYSPSATTAPAQRMSTGTAVLLELVPLLWIVSVVLWFALSWIPGVDDVGGGLASLTGLAALVSGIGWIAIGRPGIGCSLMLLRAVGLVVLAVVALTAVFSDWDCSDCDSTDNAVSAILALIGGVVLLVIVPIVSAVVPAATQRRRA